VASPLLTRVRALLPSPCRHAPKLTHLRSEDGWHDGRQYVFLQGMQSYRICSLTLHTAVGLVIGFIFGATNIIRFGPGPNGMMRTLGQYMVGSAATFGYAQSLRGDS